MRYHGKVGYVWTEEKIVDGIETGIYEQHHEEHIYIGETISLKSSWRSSENLNDNIQLNNSFSIVADPFAFKHFQHMKYIEFMGVKWSIVTVDVKRPRILLTIGGEYNGEQTNTASGS